MTENAPKRRGRPPKDPSKAAQQNPEPSDRRERLTYPEQLRRKTAAAISFLETRLLPVLPQLTPTADLTHVGDAIRDLISAWPKVAEHKSFDNVVRVSRQQHTQEITVGMVVQLTGQGFIRTLHAYGEKAARGPWTVESVHGKMIVLSSKSVKGAKVSEGHRTITDNSSLAARKHDKLVKELVSGITATQAAPDNSLV